jgi:hypothetical protein
MQVSGILANRTLKRAQLHTIISILEFGRRMGLILVTRQAGAARRILVFKAILGISIIKCTLKCFQDHNIGFQGQCKVWNPLNLCLVMKWCSTPIASKPTVHRGS